MGEVETSIEQLDDTKWRIKIDTNIGPNKLNDANALFLINKIMDIVRSSRTKLKLINHKIGPNIRPTIKINTGASNIIKDTTKYLTIKDFLRTHFSKYNNLNITLIDKDVTHHFFTGTESEGIARSHITIGTTSVIEIKSSIMCIQSDAITKEFDKWRSFHSSFKIPKLPIALSQSPTKLIKILSNTLSSTIDTDNVVDIILSYIMHPHTTYDY